MYYQKFSQIPIIQNEDQNLFRSLSGEKATSILGRHDRVLLTYLDGFEGYGNTGCGVFKEGIQN